MRYFIALAMLFYSGASGLPAVAQAGGQIGGTYAVEGTRPDGGYYIGTALIKPEGNRYHFSWQFTNKTYEGNGTRQGNTVTVNWGQEYPAIYVIGPRGILYGTWDNGRGTEILTPTPRSR